MEYKAISKKTMRSKDFKALRAWISYAHCNYRRQYKRSTLSYTAWILSSGPAIEISVTQAQAFYDTYGIRVETGW